MGSRQQAAIRGDEKAGAGNPAAGLVQFRRVIGVDLWERSGIRLQELGRRDRWWLDRLHRWLGGDRLGEHWSGPRRHRSRGRRPDQVIARSDGDVKCFTADDAAECEAKEMGTQGDMLTRSPRTIEQMLQTVVKRVDLILSFW